MYASTLSAQCCPAAVGRRSRRSSLCAGCRAQAGGDRDVWLLDYGAGNVRSVRNAVAHLGYSLREARSRSAAVVAPLRLTPCTRHVQVNSPSDISRASRLLFPGVGAFGTAMDVLRERGYVAPLLDYLREGRPFLGVCLGLQLLFEGSEESGGVEGLGLVPGRVRRFPPAARLPVPHVGWSGLAVAPGVPLLEGLGGSRVYFVHSYRAEAGAEASRAGWEAAVTDYGGGFVSAVARGGVNAVQFHPEKSGPAGDRVLARCLPLD